MVVLIKLQATSLSPGQKPGLDEKCQSKKVPALTWGQAKEVAIAKCNKETYVTFAFSLTKLDRGWLCYRNALKISYR